MFGLDANGERASSSTHAPGPKRARWPSSRDVSRDGDGGDDDENREDAAASTISLAACMSESIAWLAGWLRYPAPVRTDEEMAFALVSN